MTIATGSRLGPYEILAPIGAGGMGEVYRARDPRLGRDVAIKVLPASFSADADRLRRFEQEARAAGILNHPNITAVFDIGEDQQTGSPYVVQELLEGETLRQALAGGLSPRKAIDHAIQIAHGLAAAHEKGIVHRDLKPENVFVTKDGRLKILDFGLAKLTHMEEGGQTNVPTHTAGTEPGMILGTLGYMSPEQVRGRPADARSDIFSFGAILYEMLAGQRAFKGDSAADTMSSILKEDPPDISVTNRNVTPGVERIVRHCLEKNPEQRFQSARDLAFDLESLSINSAPGTARSDGPEIAVQRSRRRRWTAAAGGFGLLAIAAGLVLFPRRTATPARTLRVSLVAPHGSLSVGPIAISPDGSHVAFVSLRADGKRSLCVRSLDTVEPKILPDTEDAAYPFWSPDGRSLGFFALRKLKRVDLAGGPPRDLADVAEPRGGTWSPAGDIVYAPSPGGPLYRVGSSGGGAPTPVTHLDASRRETSHRWPSFLPDGRHFLYLDRSPQTSDRLLIEVGSLDGKEKRRVLEADTGGVYSAGKLYFARKATLLAQAFDPATLRLSGEPAPVVQDVWRDLQTDGLTAYAVSANGILAYRGGGFAVNELVWFDRDGRRLGSLGPPGSWASPALSPDGRHVAVDGTEIAQVTGSIYLMDSSGNVSRFSFGTWNDTAAAWSPDGSKLAFASDRKGPFDLYVKDAGGNGDATPLLENSNWKYAESWSPDGRFLAYREIDPHTKSDLWFLPLGGDRKPIPFLRTEADEKSAAFSPDGKFIAYVSNETGNEQVYVQAFPASGSKWQVSSAGGTIPRWRRDGKELFFIGADRRVMAVPIEMKESRLSPGLPKALFGVASQQYAAEERNFEVSTDGQRFLILTSAVDEIASPITIVVDVPQP